MGYAIILAFWWYMFITGHGFNTQLSTTSCMRSTSLHAFTKTMTSRKLVARAQNKSNCRPGCCLRMRLVTRSPTSPLWCKRALQPSHPDKMHADAEITRMDMHYTCVNALLAPSGTDRAVLSKAYQ